MLHKIQNLLVILKTIQKLNYGLFLSSLAVLYLIMAISSGQSIINGDTINSNNVAMAQTADQETMGPSNENNTSTSLSSTTTTASKTQGEIYGPMQKEEAAKPNRQITLVTEDAEIDIAPGKRVKAWTFNGTVPGPTIRLAEGENITVKYINKSPIPHTIHFHGNHDDVNDGVTPQIMPNQTYLYNITGEPAGALMYHCHAPPTSLHIRMGMYGALIVDPIDKPLLPAKEFVMVMGEYSLKNQLGFDADYYFINGYADQYVHNPLQINHGDLMRIYLINLGTTIPSSFHLHSTTFLAYPSGLWINSPIYAQTVSVAPGDASIVEAKWKYPGDYFFHAHGIQEEKGNMGMIKVVVAESNGNTTNTNTSNINTTNSSSSSSTSVNTADESSVTNSIVSLNPENNNNNTQQQQQQPPTGSVSMLDWQYDLQKKLQSPQPINYSQSEGVGNESEVAKEGGHMTETKKTQRHGENLSLSLDKTLPTNVTTTNNTGSNSTLTGEAHTIKEEKEANHQLVSIVPGSSNPDSKIFYEPPNAELELGAEVKWTNDDKNMPHTVTSGNPESGPTGVFDSGIINGDGSSFGHTFDSQGEYEYYCTLHPWMIAKITVK